MGCCGVSGGNDTKSAAGSSDATGEELGAVSFPPFAGGSYAQNSESEAVSCKKFTIQGGLECQYYK